MLVDIFFFFHLLAKLNYFQQPQPIKESDFLEFSEKYGRLSFLAVSQVQPSFSAFYRVSWKKDSNQFADMPLLLMSVMRPNENRIKYSSCIFPL